MIGCFVVWSLCLERSVVTFKPKLPSARYEHVGRLFIIELQSQGMWLSLDVEISGEKLKFSFEGLTTFAVKSSAPSSNA